ncbi:hypothetical protein [Streptomyces longwoodensis]|uniref:hypothetical protein n=1 Tax=Streptomyces longwoodensis TaxID=68231 RepID=UPI0033DA56D8
MTGDSRRARIIIIEINESDTTDIPGLLRELTLTSQPGAVIIQGGENMRDLYVSGQAGNVGPHGSATSSSFNTGGDSSIMNDQYNVNQAGAVGREAKAEGNTFSQVFHQGADITSLVAELEFLRSEMRKNAQTLEDDLAVAAIGQAQVCIQGGDTEVTRSHLARAGSWALETASAIGTQVAAAAIRASMGLS